MVPAPYPSQPVTPAAGTKLARAVTLQGRSGRLPGCQRFTASGAPATAAMPHTTPPHTPTPDPSSTQPAARIQPATGAPSPVCLPGRQVPLSVWPVPVTGAALTPTGGWGVPPLLTQRLLAVYTHPGDTVLAAGGSARRVAATAAELGRRPPTLSRHPAAGSVSLVTATPGQHQPAGPDAYRRWARLLTPTGVLAVVLSPDRPPDQPTLVVAAAAGAGLSYLQHIIAVLWPLHEDHLDPPTNPTHPDAGAAALPPAHADVLVFTATAEPTPGPGPARLHSRTAHPGSTR